MSTVPHPDSKPLSVSCAVITISDTRTTQNDRSGQLIQEFLTEAGHHIFIYQILPDEPSQISTLLQELGAHLTLDAIIFNGGTGIAPRDTTYEAVSQLLEKILPGFGEIFRFLSYQEIGSRAIASRAIAGIYRQKLVFLLPGSSNAVKLALEKLIIPELSHLIKQLKGA
ncbi:molybdenum cofactor biosynthesis protein B [Chroococcus sp. FPU101]|uniref:MogA/MoaB family molybdenum cofactor biosynthesis protein n=1 Tax=Chroococcus sp. FPU101 TaxID=1974212 RepID=UPI001A90AFF8|nr:MogA/MoaB family molybdenum cofactor biosynthesis protein [Chroococcus sp. FPU101]GFE69981.1 molybdenum cofactor synthesis domain protein [Chroococcus sp. FPU101]